MKPRKKRDVLYPPKIQFFKPQGIPLKDLTVINLTIDEYEAVRLADFEKLKHEDAAKKMNISRPTFTRLLESAHNKISDAIINGKAIRIEGGDFNFLGNRYQCRVCGNLWDIEKDTEKIKNNICPNCKSSEVDDIAEKMFLRCQKNKRGRFRHGWG